MKNQQATIITCFVLFLLAFSTCTTTQPTPLHPAFYHWQTNATISTAEYDFLNEIACKRIYIRLFDVVWGSDGPINLASIAVNKVDLDLDEIVPVVFIAERTFKNLRADGVDSLADKVLDLMHQYLPDMDQSDKIQEIQFDCDWAKLSKTEYFLFLEAVRKKVKSHIKISSTIRLHQYKFPEETGLPPSDKAMLMLYNTGQIKDFEEKNSILSTESAQTYLHGTTEPYPLPLDIALPAYDWMLLFRNEKLHKIIYPPQTHYLADSIFFKKTDEQHWEVKKSVQFAAHYLNPGDILKLERSEATTIDE